MPVIANIAEILDEPSRRAPERAALIVAGKGATGATGAAAVCTYGELQAETDGWSATLADRGVIAGDRIALVDWGGVRSTAVTLAAARLGAATAQMNPLLTASELAQLVEVSGCSSVAVSGPDGRVALGDAVGDRGTILDASTVPADVPARAPGGAADALVLFTSGTTGLPKPVAISHDSILARVSAYRAPFDPDRPPNVSIMCVPSFHVGGMLGLLVSLYAGDTTVIQPRFDAGGWLAAVQRHRVAAAFVVPTMLARILDHPDLAATDLSSLRSLSYGAAAAPGDLIQRAMTQWPGVAFANVFGQTETLGAYTSLSPDDHRDPLLAGSIGRVMPGVDVRIVDPETNRDVSSGHVGELWVRGSQTIGEGWLHTGDLVHRDDQGYLFPSGRRSDVINRGGEKFAPVEVADVLREHPSFADLVVVGVPDAEMGERVGIAAVLRPGCATPTVVELRAWGRDRLAPFKLPEVLAIVDALPYNELGKLPRRAAVEVILSAGRVEEKR